MTWLVASALANTGSMAVPVPGSISQEGVQVTAFRRGETVVFEVDVPCGMHVYGRKEKLGLPLAVIVDGKKVRATVPPGERTVTHPELPPSYWLEGLVTLEARTEAHAGELRVQACTDDTCYPPERLPWSVSLPESPAK
ncbi:MAG: hypothetical protein AAGA48_11470 [Myxococcota bacterium]